MNYITDSIENIIKYYQSHLKNGLENDQISLAQEKWGNNTYSEQKKETLGHKIKEHLLEMMNLVLLFVAILSFYLAWINDQNFTKTVVVLLIVLINITVAILQENRAETALTALKKMASPTSTVIRDGKKQNIASQDLVCGDLIELSAGMQVGADVRLLSANALQIDESALTGESEPISKDAQAVITDRVPLGDQLHMVFSGTNVLNGTAQGIVVAVGNQSQMGQIANLLESQIKTKTPLQKRIDRLAKRLTIIAFLAGAVIFCVNYFMNDIALIDNLMTAVVLGIAAVPETLPVIVTLSLIYGVENMARKNAIIRNIPSVETLGNATVIASDKTGTLTQNKMTIQKLWLKSEKIWTSGQLTSDEIQMLHYFALSSNATAHFESQKWHVHGDPTEAAIIHFLIDHDLYQPELFPKRIAELPFDSTRKKMSVVITDNHSKEGKYLVLTKGAFDRIVSNDADAKNIHDQFADQALRVLALSYKHVDELPSVLTEIEQDQTFLGIIGMIDPPRPESKTAVAEARAAGIKPLMITGDHALTAKAIAKTLDIYREGDQVVDGITLSALTEDELQKNLKHITVYARVSPEDKLRIVKAWQKENQIVAMTGDGVNDAPSLRAADVGTAMGIAGTEVSKSASDIILTDDNFATIVAAIKEGRRVYANIKKTIYYLLSANIAEILIMLIGAIIGWGLPFTGIQLLYINVLADGIPGFGLSREKADKDIMSQAPIGVNESLFSREVNKRIIVCSTSFIMISLIGFSIGRFVEIQGQAPSHILGQTMAFTILTLASTINVYNARSNHSIFSTKNSKNNLILITTLLSLIITLLFTHIPFLMTILGVVSLTPIHWLIAISLSAVSIVSIEIYKLILNKNNKKFIS